MQTLKVRKNFLIDSDMIEKATVILKQKHKNLTEALELYFQAIVKDPNILETIEQSATQRSGKFIGLLDGKISDINFKQIKKEKYEDIS